MSLIPENLAPFACSIMKNSNQKGTEIPKQLILNLLQTHKRLLLKKNSKNITPDFLSSIVSRINEIVSHTLKD